MVNTGRLILFAVVLIAVSAAAVVLWRSRAPRSSEQHVTGELAAPIAAGWMLAAAPLSEPRCYRNGARLSVAAGDFTLNGNTLVSPRWSPQHQPGDHTVCDYEYVEEDIPLSVSVSATSPTQAVLKYAASGAPCKVEVSESASYSPVVHDVDAGLFAGANLDNSAGALSAATSRLVVVGARVIQTGYSRALQQNTQHYYRVSCGARVATGTFKTKILPVGVTYQDLMPLKADGTYNFPSTTDTRNESLIDSQTGVLLKRVNLPTDNSPNSAPGPSAGGFGTFCSSTLDAQGNYHCIFPDYPQGIYPNLYSIHPQTGEARFLGAAFFQRYAIDENGASIVGLAGGELVMWDQTDANVAYQAVRIAATARQTIAKWTYTGKDDPAANLAGTPQQSAHTVVDLLGGADLNALVAAFDSRFDRTRFACSAVGLQSHYFLLKCARGYQNTYAWEGAYDLGNGLALGAGGTGHVAALAPSWAIPGCRWCGDHTYEYVGDAPVYSFALHSLSGLSSPPYDGGGPYASVLTAAVPAASSGDTTTIQISSTWNANWGAAPSEWSAGEPVSPRLDHFLQVVQPGDILEIDNEELKLKMKTSSTTWVVERGLKGRAAPAHAAGRAVLMECDDRAAVQTEDGGYLFWDFASSPHGTTPADWVLNFGAHPVSRGQFRVDSGYPIRAGAVTDKSTWGKPPDMSVTSHPVFGGQSAPGDGNSYQKHASMASGDDSAFYDVTYFVGTSLFSAQNSTATTHLSGSLYQYHYETGVSYASGTPIARKHFPTLAKTKGRALVDISGPGAVLTGGAEDNYKYCVAGAAGECVTGSAVGNVYFNHPALDPAYPWCTGGENGIGVSDICIGNFAPMGLAAMQYRIANDSTGGKSYRPLARTFQNFEGAGNLSSNLKLTNGGEWAFFMVLDSRTPPNPATRLFALKVPPAPAADGIDRSTFVPASVSLTPPAGLAIASARIKFGYAEQGGAGDYFCTSRREACVAAASAINEANPFSFAETDSYSPLACAASCAIAIPVYPLHAAYYLVEFLNGAGAVVATQQGVAVEGVNVVVR